MCRRAAFSATRTWLDDTPLTLRVAGKCTELSSTPVVVHAAAGGLGQLITQMAVLHGASVIGVVSREAKVDAARSAGATEVLIAGDADGDALVEAVAKIVGEDGAHAVFDGNGGTTFFSSMKMLRRNGTLLYYGPLIGGVPQITMAALPRSIKVAFPQFLDHIDTPERLLTHTNELFEWLLDGRVKANIGGRYSLSDAGRAHSDLESRATTGKLSPRRTDFRSFNTRPGQAS
jgi:NADPH2:quinone reductase